MVLSGVNRCCNTQRSVYKRDTKVLMCKLALRRVLKLSGVTLGEEKGFIVLKGCWIGYGVCCRAAEEC